MDQPGVDVFGQVYNQWKNKECVCPNCSRSIAASRFAPHLEKCLGMGRNSSRIANRRYTPWWPPSRRSLSSSGSRHTTGLPWPPVSRRTLRFSSVSDTLIFFQHKARSITVSAQAAKPTFWLTNADETFLVAPVDPYLLRPSSKVTEAQREYLQIPLGKGRHLEKEGTHQRDPY